MPRVREGSVDRYAPAESSKEDGADEYRPRAGWKLSLRILAELLVPRAHPSVGGREESGHRLGEPVCAPVPGVEAPIHGPFGASRNTSAPRGKDSRRSIQRVAATPLRTGARDCRLIARGQHQRARLA